MLWGGLLRRFFLFSFHFFFFLPQLVKKYAGEDIALTAGQIFSHYAAGKGDADGASGRKAVKGHAVVDEQCTSTPPDGVASVQACG